MTKIINIKTLSKIGLVLLIGLFSFNLGFAQDRNVIWAHGINEDRDIWQVYDNLFQTTRLMNTNRLNNAAPNNQTRVDYGGAQGIQPSADIAKADIVGLLSATGATETTNIGIGHSMGGVVFREIDRDYSTNVDPNVNIGGIITVGSPNYGAGIANAINNGTATAVLQDGCSRLASGPISELIPLPINIGGWASDALCDFLWDEFVIPDLRFPAGWQSQGMTDLAEGSDYFTQTTAGTTTPNNQIGLNHYQSTIPRISIWGNETSPVHWRVASSFVTEAADDQLIPDIAHQFRGYYNNMYTYNTSITVATGLLGILKPSIWAMTPVHGWRAYQWKKGRNWFDNSETIWNTVIRCDSYYAISFTTTVYNAQTCNDNYSTGSQDWINCIQQQCGGNLSNCYQQTTVTHYGVANGQSDGVVCKHSQQLIGLPQNNYYEARGVNHRDETDNTSKQTPSGIDEIERNFRLIWNRPEDDFFHTKPR